MTSQLRTLVLSTLLVVAWLPSLSQARPARYNSLLGRLGVGSLPFRCQTCHRSGGVGLNQFGADYFSTFIVSMDPKFRDVKNLSEDEKWKFLLGLDSDGDGLSNLDELIQGRNPGVKDQ